MRHILLWLFLATSVNFWECLSFAADCSKVQILGRSVSTLRMMADYKKPSGILTTANAREAAKFSKKFREISTETSQRKVIVIGGGLSAWQLGST